MHTNLKTIDDLKRFINVTLSTFNKHDDQIDVHWFVAMFEARQLLDQCSLKDVASMLQEGTKKIDDEYVESWLSSMYENYGAEGIEPDIVQHIGYMYNEDA